MGCVAKHRYILSFPVFVILHYLQCMAYYFADAVLCVRCHITAHLSSLGVAAQVCVISPLETRNGLASTAPEEVDLFKRHRYTKKVRSSSSAYVQS